VQSWSLDFSPDCFRSACLYILTWLIKQFCRSIFLPQHLSRLLLVPLRQPIWPEAYTTCNLPVSDAVDILALSISELDLCHHTCHRDSSKVSPLFQWYWCLGHLRASIRNRLHFLKLAKKMDSRSPDCRHNSIVLLDNASYHQGNYSVECYNKLGINILFLGPYQFRMAPVESNFSYIKGHDLNPL
jgi:hypothetical protein